MRSILGVLADVFVVVGAALLGAGLWARFGWEIASIIGGTILLVSGGVAGRRNVSRDVVS